jgi:hypothetical protein
MPDDTMSPSVEVVFRRIQQHVAVHATPFKKMDADNVLGRNSASVFVELVTRGTVRDLGSGELFAPTLAALVQWNSSLVAFFTDVLQRARYEYSKSRNLIGVSAMVEAITNNRSMILPEEKEQLEFYLGCALPDFKPILEPTGGGPGHLPTLIEISADILSVLTLEDLRAFQLEHAAKASEEVSRPNLLERTGGTTMMPLFDKVFDALKSQAGQGIANCYRQAVNDLADETRISLVGPAAELRVAITEALRILAPDDEVVAIPGFKATTQTGQPSWVQRAEFILAKRHKTLPPGRMTILPRIDAGIAELTKHITDSSSKGVHTIGVISDEELAKLLMLATTAFADLLL